MQEYEPPADPRAYDKDVDFPVFFRLDSGT